MPFVADQQSGFVPDPSPEQPNMPAANAAFARAAGATISTNMPIADQMKEGVRLGIENFVAPFEAATNVATGLFLGFPARVGASLAGLAQKHVLGMDVDPKEIADTVSEIFTYKPQTQQGKAIASQLMWPLEKISEGAEYAGHGVTNWLMNAGVEDERHRAKYGQPAWQKYQPDTTARRAADQDFLQNTAAPVAGAITEQAVQMLGPMLLGELGRKMGGQRIDAADMQNVSKVVAGKAATPSAVAATEASLRSIYDKTGIGPFTIADAAGKDPALRAQLADPAIDIPPTLEQYVTRPEAPATAAEVPTPDGRIEPTFDPGRIPPETLAEHGLEDTPQTRDQLSAIAQAATIDESAVRAAAETHANDEPAFHQAIQGIINETREEPGAGAGASGTRAGETAAPESQSAAGPARAFRHGQFNSGIDPAAVLDAVRGTVKSVKDAADGIVNSEVGQEAVRAVMPMSAGTQIAQAAAQRFANAMRNARFQWQRISAYLQKEFTPEERSAMWEAADEQNVLLMNGADTAGKGLDRLTPRQRGVVLELHDLANGLWARAKAAGMVEGEGLPFWTPRMAVLIGEDGEFMRPSGEGGRTTAKGQGANVRTTASSLKQRKYELAGETEAAMKSALGDNAQLVRDIGTMPLAMARMAQAIAGRELVNQLRELGQVSGKEIVSDSVRPGFTTIDHPAFTTYRPEFVTDVDGKVVPRLDEDGRPVMQRTPMLISNEWAGPLEAVLSKQDGAIYSALMLAKSKAMAAIMLSPAAHNMVIFGRALAYDPAAVMSLRAYFAGHALAKDVALMSRAISDGMVPIGANKGSMMDITDVARAVGREGGWGDPNQSWINLSVQKVASIFSQTAADAIKAKMDAFGDFWHHDLLWKQVGALQTYIYNDYYNHMIANGHPPEVAGPVAANLANRYGGAVAAENSSEMVRKALNLILFSRSFNVGNVGAVHDAAFGLPAGLRAKMFAEAGEEAGTKGAQAAAGKARMGLVADLGMSMLMTAAASAAVAKLLLNQTAEDIANGYGRRLSAMLGNIHEHPLSPGSYNPYRILPTWENEAGKQDRIDLGAQPGGQHEYLRLPTGKVVEDTVGWLLHAPDTFVKKMSPTAKGIWEAVKDEKGFGVPVENPEGGTLQHIAQGIQHVLEAQVPMDTLKTLWDVTQGVGTPIDKDKLAGFATGFTVSKGNPGGPEEGAFYAMQDRVTAMKKFQMEAVRDDIKHGREAEAFDRLKAIGVPPREIASTIRNIKEPRQGMSKQQARKFAAGATDEDRAAMDNARRQITSD